MALNMITSIKKAEAEAEKIVKGAQAESKQILKDATDRAYRIISDAEEKAEKEAAKAVLQGEASAEGECKKIAETCDREIAALKALCADKTEKAANLIVSRIGR